MTTGRRVPALLAHCAVLAVALAALAPLMSLDSSFTSDEGAYAIQARSVADGHWHYEHRLASLDPEGTYFPIANSARQGDRWYPYPQHPLVPLLLSVAWPLPGHVVLLHLPSLLGVVGCAAAAWLLAGRMNKRARPIAFWLAAGGPVLANGWMLWAHAPSAAVSGLALLAVLEALRRPRPSMIAAAAVALILGVLLRSEGALLAGACGAAVVVLRWQDRRRPVVLAAVVGPAMLALGAKLAERAWTAAVAGGPVGESGRATSSDFVQGRFEGAWHEILQGRFEAGPAWLGPTAVVLAIGAGLLLRRDDQGARRQAAILLAAAAALVLARLLITPDDPVTGLLAAWPIAAVGMAALDRARVGWYGVALAAVCAVFTAAVLATQYSVGGGLEWGGRFLSPLAAPLAALAAVAVHDRVVPAALGLAAASAVAALVVVGVVRHDHDQAIDDVAAHARSAVVTTQSALPRLAWRLDGRIGWLLVSRADAPAVASAAAGRPGGTLVALGSRESVSLPDFRQVPVSELESTLLRLWVSQ